MYRKQLPQSDGARFLAIVRPRPHSPFGRDRARAPCPSAGRQSHGRGRHRHFHPRPAARRRFLATALGLCSYRLRPCQRDLPGVHRLRRLNLDYVDLVYPQQPVGDIKAAWRNLETAVRQGKVRTLGLSNFEVPGAEDWPSPVSPTVSASTTPAARRRSQNPDPCRRDAFWSVSPYPAALLHKKKTIQCPGIESLSVLWFLG